MRRPWWQKKPGTKIRHTIQRLPKKAKARKRCRPTPLPDAHRQALEARVEEERKRQETRRK